jgi:hypothetical protein
MAEANPILARSEASQNPPTQDDLIFEGFTARAKAAEGKASTPPANPRLQAIEDTLARNNQRLNATTAQLESGAASVNDATEIIRSSMGEITSSTQIVRAATDNAKLATQNNANALLSAAGGVPEQVQLMSRLKSEGDHVSNLLAQQADILDDEPTGLYLLDQIVNGFRAAPIKRDLKVAAIQQNQTIGQIQNMTAAQEGFARVNVLNEQTLNEASIAANSRLIASEGAVKLAEVEIRNIHTNADMMSRLVNADSRITSNLLESYRLEESVANRQLSEERMQFEREEMTFRRDQWELAKPKQAAELELLQSELADNRALAPVKRVAMEAQYKTAVKSYNDGILFEQDLVQGVQKAQSMSGLPIETPEVINFKLSNTSTRDRYIKLQEVGNSSNLQLGGNAYDAAVTLRTIDTNGIATETKGTALLDTIARQQLAAYEEAGVKVPKDETSFKADFNATAKGLLQGAAKTIATGDTTNPYQAPPMSVIEQFANVQNSPLWQNVLANQGMVEVDPQRITESAAAGVAAKLITPEEAAKGIVTIFESAALYNNTMQGGFSRVGLGEFNQSTYNSPIKYKQSFMESLKGNVPLLEKSLVVNSVAKAGAALFLASGPLVPTTKVELVNLMDRAKVQQMIIKQLSNVPPVTTTTP